MAYDFTAATSHYLQWGTGFNGRTFSAAAWVNPRGTTSTGYVFSGMFDGTNGWFVRRDTTDPAKWACGLGGFDSILGVGTVTADTWQHMVLTIDNAAADMLLYHNNSLIGSNTSINPLWIEGTGNFGVGNRDDLARDWEGGICDAALWIDYNLTADQRAMLALGYSPFFINPRPTWYAPLVGNISDLIGAKTATNTNATPTVAHPRIYFPAPGLSFDRADDVAAGGGTNVWRTLMGVGG